MLKLTAHKRSSGSQPDFFWSLTGDRTVNRAVVSFGRLLKLWWKWKIYETQIWHFICILVSKPRESCVTGRFKRNKCSNMPIEHFQLTPCGSPVNYKTMDKDKIVHVMKKVQLPTRYLDKTIRLELWYRGHKQQ